MSKLKISVLILGLLVVAAAIIWKTGVLNPVNRFERNLESGTESAYREYIDWLLKTQRPGWESRIQELCLEAARIGITEYEKKVYDQVLTGELQSLSEATFSSIHKSLLGKNFGPSLFREYEILKGTDPSRATDYLLKAAEQRHPQALFTASQQFLQHEDPDLVNRYGIPYLRKSAEAGYADAEYNLGMLYLTGDGVPKNTTTAYEWLFKASRREHPQAMYQTGSAYLLSPRSGSDLTEGRRLLEKALNAGVREARLPLARQMLKEFDGEKALPFLYQLAFEGNKEAIHLLEKYDSEVRYPGNIRISKAWSSALLEEDNQAGNSKPELDWDSRIKAHYIDFIRETKTQWDAKSSTGETFPMEWLDFNPVQQALIPYSGCEEARKLALRGDPEATFSLYLHFRDKNDEEEFMYWLHMAAKLDHKEACWNMYLLLKEREPGLSGIEKSEMEHLFQRALLDRQPDAMLAFALRLIENPQSDSASRNRALWDAHLAGNPEALPMLKERLLNGIGFTNVDKDWIPEVEKWADQGVPMAELIVARELLSGVLPIANSKSSRRLFKREVLPKEHPETSQEKVDKAVRYLKSAVESGNTKAMEHLLWIFLRGTLPSKDEFNEKYDDRFGLFYMVVNTELTGLYSMLEGKVPFDPDAAYDLVSEWKGPSSTTIRWLQAILNAALWKDGVEGLLETSFALHKLAEEGYEPALTLFPERDLEWRENEAREYTSLFEVLIHAEQGDPHAMTHGARIFIYKVQDDADEFDDVIDLALDYLDAAADEEYIPALITMSGLYKEGKVVREDMIRSLRYVEMAAEAGDLSAQETIGYAYGTGSIVAKDSDKAMRFLSMAVDQGSQTAKEYMERLELASGVSDSTNDVMDWMVQNSGLRGEFFPVIPHVISDGCIYPVDGFSWGQPTMWNGEKSTKVPENAEYLWLAREQFHPGNIEVSNPTLLAPLFYMKDGESTPLGSEITYTFDVVSATDLQDVLVILIRRFGERDYRSFQTISRLIPGREKTVQKKVKNRYSNPSNIGLIFLVDGEEVLSNARMQPFPFEGYDPFKHKNALKQHVESNKDETLPGRSISGWPQIFGFGEDQKEVAVTIGVNKRGAITSIELDPDQRLSLVTRSRIFEEINKMTFMPPLENGEPLSGYIKHQFTLY